MSYSFVYPTRSFQPKRSCISVRLCLLVLSGLPLYLFSLPAASSQIPTAPASPVTSSKPSPLSLTQDARLQQTITLDETPISLADLLRKYSDKNLSLTCTGACKDQKLQIRLVKRPLVMLMTSLAELLPGEWTLDKETGGYRFLMSQAAQTKRTRWGEAFLRARASAIDAQTEATLQQLQTPLTRGKLPTTIQEGFTPEQQLKTRETQIADRAFYNSLAPDLLQRIAGNINLIPFYRTPVHATGVQMNGNATARLGDLPEDIRTSVRKTASKFTLNNDATVYFTNSGHSIDTMVDTSDGYATMAGPSAYIVMSPFSPALFLNQQPLANAVKKLGNNAPLDWKLLASYQNSRVWPNDTASVEPANPTHPQLPRRRSDVLRWLANVADMEYVADYYSVLSKPLSGPTLHQPLSSTLPQELNHCALEQDLSWKKQTSGIYLLRDNRWYRNDMLEVSQSMLTKWLAAWISAVPSEKAQSMRAAPPLPEAIRLQMDWEAEFVVTLTPWQLANGLPYFGRETGNQTYDPKQPAYKLLPFYSVGNHCLENYDTVRFYASLDTEQRDLISHNRLPLFALTADQQQQALVLLPPLHAYIHTVPPHPVLIGFFHPEFSFTIGVGNNPGSGVRDPGAPEIFPLKLVVIQSAVQ